MNQVRIVVENNRMNVTLPDDKSGSVSSTLEGADAANVASMLYQKFSGGSAPSLNQLVTQQTPAPIANPLPASAAATAVKPLGRPVMNFRKMEPEPAAPAVPQPPPAAAAPVSNGTVKPLGLPVWNFANPMERRGKGQAAPAAAVPVTNNVKPLGPTPPLFPRR